MRVAVGMSGYAYPEWKGSFYPDGLPADGMLGFYAGRFPTVEINNTFYRLPSEQVVLGWAAQVPPGFRFAIKASRRITHDRRLRDAGDLLDYLIRNVAVLGERRGPLLFQLPPTMPMDLDRLAAFLAILPSGWQVAVEWRHPSWFDERTYALLRDHGVAAVVSEQDEPAPPVVSTASWGYLRLHRAGYGAADLESWAARIRSQPWEECFVYFKHEEQIAGPAVAAAFADLTAPPPA